MTGRDDDFARGNPDDYRPMTDGYPAPAPIGGGIRIPQVGRGAQEQIGTALRGMYDELLAEPVPDHLADLVRRLG